MVIVHDGCGNGGSGGDDGGCDGESPGDSCGDHNASNRFESSADMNAKPWPKPPPRVHVTAGERVHRLQVGRRAPLESGCCCGWLAPTLASPLCFVCVRATCAAREGGGPALRYPFTDRLCLRAQPGSFAPFFLCLRTCSRRGS